MVDFLYNYIIVINFIALVMMMIDKGRAIADKWRIPERTLFIVFLLGGSVGGFIGMKIFRHKTQKIGFYIGLPILMVIHMVVFVALYSAAKYGIGA